MKNIKKLVLFVTMLIVVGGVNVYAATVGDQLLQPEEGWQRYDDRDSMIQYSGTSLQKESDNYFDNTQTYYIDPNHNGKIRFNFRGTKLRIITSRYTERSNNIKIKIDENIETYSEYGNIVYSCLVYEKKGLSDSVHSVEIYQPNNEIFGLDAIDTDGEFISYIQQPSNLMAITQNTNIELTWDAVSGADSYTILRSTTSDAIDTVIASAVTETTYIDNDIEPGVIYYYIVRALKNGVESPDSNIASAMVEKLNTAVLQIKLSTTDVYEYRITMNEVDNFMKWYIDRANGTGLPFYSFSDESKIEPYTDVNEYLIYDKIVWFKVKEYLR
ncbi:hypothetical protein [Vallitalea guaymasensis]|uniref:hypothetical protein n=1 Tax=Vallitalea guaymasensis TaxID=1185412 RepID=UPI0023569488|nr:hypothetical protein [Vallitalea guaymasensis]